MENSEMFRYEGFGQILSKTFEKPLGFRSDPIIAMSLKASLALFILQLVFLAINFRALPTQIPLFYSLPWGEKRLASAQLLFLLPVVSLVFLLINNILSKKMYNYERLLARICSCGSLTSVFLLSITLLKIINIIT